MIEQDRIETLVKLLEQLLTMLKQHLGEQHAPGVVAVIRQLSDQSLQFEDRIAGARSIFRTMMGGMGTLGDFVIWYDDEGLRECLNLELGRLESELWTGLGC